MNISHPNTAFYLLILVKLVVAFISVLIYIKLIGRTILSQVSGIDLIQNIILGGLVGGIIYNPGISILQFAIVLLMWTVILFLVVLICKKNGKLRRIIEGSIIPLVIKGKLNMDGFKKAKMDLMTFANELKNKGIYDITKVYFAQLEQNGSITAFTDDFNKYAVLLIMDGQINNVYLSGLGKDENWLKKMIKEQGYDKVSDIFLAQWSEKKIFIIPKSKENTVTVNKDKS